MIKIEKLFIGKPKQLPFYQFTTSIDRTEVAELIIHTDRIENDDVFNKVHHGGPQRVVHHYPLEHSQYFQNVYPNHNFKPGRMGENMSTTGLLEKDVCIGDVYGVGNVRLVVTEPRKPCATINHQFSLPGLARQVQNTSRTGWFYKVLIPGTISTKDKITLIERPYPTFTIDLCVQALLVKPDHEILKLIVNNPAISENWKKPAAEFLATGKMPDDGHRLGGD